MKVIVTAAQLGFNCDILRQGFAAGKTGCHQLPKMTYYTPLKMILVD